MYYTEDNFWNSITKYFIFYENKKKMILEYLKDSIFCIKCRLFLKFLKWRKHFNEKFEFVFIRTIILHISLNISGLNLSKEHDFNE